MYEKGKLKCGGCGKVEMAGLKYKCAQCEEVYYCDRSCQKKDWKAGHKEVCGLVKKHRIQEMQSAEDDGCQVYVMLPIELMSSLPEDLQKVFTKHQNWLHSEECTRDIWKKYGTRLHSDWDGWDVDAAGSRAGAADVHVRAVRFFIDVCSSNQVDETLKILEKTASEVFGMEFQRFFDDAYTGPGLHPKGFKFVKPNWSPSPAFQNELVKQAAAKQDGKPQSYSGTAFEPTLGRFDFLKGIDSDDRTDMWTTLQGDEPLTPFETERLTAWGQMCITGSWTDYLPNDSAKGADLFREAMARGTGDSASEAKSMLGMYYHRGDGNDAAKGIMLLQEAAEAGNIGARFNLGTALSLGHGVEQDIPAAKDLWRQIIEEESTREGVSERPVTHMYSAEGGTQKLVENSSSSYAPIAQYSLAQLMLHESHKEVRANGSVGKEGIEAMRMMIEAAKGGFQEAIKWLQEGPGGPEILQKVFEAQYNQAMERWGPPDSGKAGEDLARLAKELATPANVGNAKAQFVLGSMHQDGKGVKKDRQKAAKLLGQASAQGIKSFAQCA